MENQKQFKLGSYNIYVCHTRYNRVEVHCEGVPESMIAVMVDSQCAFVGAYEFADIEQAIDFAVNMSIKKAISNTGEQQGRDRIEARVKKTVAGYKYEGRVQGEQG